MPIEGETASRSEVGTVAPAGKDGSEQRASEPSARPRSKRARLNWPNIFWNALIHGGALAAPFTFAWWGVGLMLVLWWVTGGLGICLGFHRLFTHRSFETYRPVRWFIAWLGSLAGQGHVITWTADHRKHHALSDREGDPHSPVDGGWWSHMMWLAWTDGSDAVEAHRRRWAPDLLKDPGLRMVDRMFFVSNFLVGGALFGAGYWLGGLPAALTAVVWGVFVRLTFVLHATFLVNSATHMWGYRNYPTRDNSRNLWWVALLTYGEGWHNNHHAFPRMARCGHRWWEIDLTFLTVRLLAALGLAWNVVDRQHQTDGARPTR